jgi:glutathione S-transferase
LGGRNLSFADLAGASHLSILDYLGELNWQGFPDAALWYAKIKSRPTFAPLLDDQVAGILPSPHYGDLDF